MTMKVYYIFHKALEMTMIAHHYSGFIHVIQKFVFLQQALILLSYHVIPDTEWEKTQMIKCDVFKTTHNALLVGFAAELQQLFE